MKIRVYRVAHKGWELWAWDVYAVVGDAKKAVANGYADSENSANDCAGETISALLGIGVKRYSKAKGAKP